MMNRNLGQTSPSRCFGECERESLQAENRRLLVEKRKAEAAAGEQICLNSELEAENERLRKALDTGRRKPVQRSDGAAFC